VANVIRHFGPAMVARGTGVIVNFSSGWGRETDPNVAPYCASKWAMEGLTKALAQELPEGMAAIPLSPGIIDTDMLRSCFGGDAGAYPSPREWAKTAVPYLLSLGPADSGQSLTVGDR
jgi:NAD(P)-dependent dehydrogenase (short-subunit alcohol dehydrogenase family)